ncbi:MAG: hypothetical protein AB7F86_02330 [Bdellovibrionales bacterium]
MHFMEFTRSRIQKAALIFGSVVLMAGFQNCSETKFSSDAGSSGGGGVSLGNNDDDASGVVTQTGGPNCRDELRSLTSPVNMIFVLDASGSNVSDPPPGSDPNKAVRGDSIQRFYNSYKDKTNFSWSFIYFKGNSATTLLSAGNASSMQAAINAFMAESDNGNTPYVAALNKTADTVNTSGVKNIVVFMSDGKPNPPVNDSTLNSNVTAILNKAPGAVSFNTVYYGPTNPEASSRLSMMASTGQGNFLDTNVNPTGNAFLISDLVIVPGVVCQ